MTGPVGRWAVMAFLVVGLSGTGCGKKPQGVAVHPVRGAVFHAGSVPAGALVLFHALSPAVPGVPSPRGRVETDGTFRLTTYRTGDGAPVGEYAVTVTWKQRMDHPEEEGPDLLPVRYSQASTSPLRATVHPGANELQPFHLTKDP